MVFLFPLLQVQPGGGTHPARTEFYYKVCQIVFGLNTQVGWFSEKGLAIASCICEFAPTLITPTPLLKILVLKEEMGLGVLSF